MSLGQRWVWPYRWIKNTHYILLVNLDVWDFLKVEKGMYLGVTHCLIIFSSRRGEYGQSWCIML